MFDIAPTELLLCAVIALVVIGPRDLPKAMRLVGRWIAKARAMATHFRVGMDAMMREAELADLEKEWAERNRRIMEAHPDAATLTRSSAGPVVEPAAVPSALGDAPHDAPASSAPVMTTAGSQPIIPPPVGDAARGQA